MPDGPNRLLCRYPAADPCVAGRAGRLIRSSGAAGRGAPQRPECHIISLPSMAISRCICAPSMAPFTGPARAPRDRALPRSAEAGPGPDEGRAKSATTARLAGATPTTDASVPQRERTSPRPGADGRRRNYDGFEVTLTTERYLRNPGLAVMIQDAWPKEIGGKINLNVSTRAPIRRCRLRQVAMARLGDGLTDYGHRGVRPRIPGASRCAAAPTGTHWARRDGRSR